jgi:GNAT superfamily N-acetyltransferase
MSAIQPSIQIVEVKDRKQLRSFIEFPLALYRNDPRFAPQLTRDLLRHYSPGNPFFNDAEVSFFIATQKGEIVGRVAAIVNHRHNAYHHDQVGFFGFYESINNSAVTAALLDTVRQWLTERGMTVMRGPMNFSTNEECGFLVEGYDEPPMLMTPYNPPYYNELMTAAGLIKIKDLNAYMYDFNPDLLPKVQRVAALAERAGVTVRPVDKNDLPAVMRAFGEIYNAAWANNWGFIPFNDAELQYNAKQLKPLIVGNLLLVAEKDGKPIGFLGMIPDYNQVLRRMGGKLNPWTLLKALYYSRKITDLRLLLLGIKPEYRSRGVDALLFREGHRGIKEGGYIRLEFSWILEDNIPTNRIAELFGSRLYKRFRIYEKSITN